jgi:hypothetical protein
MKLLATRNRFHYTKKGRFYRDESPELDNQHSEKDSSQFSSSRAVLGLK